jgi:NAD(P)-dependent dehydrogenase (short-subunit alcohol dehydrogenase family)
VKLAGRVALDSARETGGLALACDVSRAEAVTAMVAAVEDHYGRIDLLVSNAGFASQELDLDDALAQPDSAWQQLWSVHVLAHLRACRAALSSMLARGSGQLVSVTSAAGLLSQCGDSAYSATKHAAVALAESLAITYGDRGIEAGQFLILTHPEVLSYFQRKANDYERWLAGMRRIRDGLRSGGFLRVRPP